MIKVKLNLRGLNQLMTGRGARQVVRDNAKRMADAAGTGFEAIERPHRWTARAYVQTKDLEGRRRQAQERVLERVVTEKST